MERWREWVDWSGSEGFEAQALLLRDLEGPQTFVSFGPWDLRAEAIAALPDRPLELYARRETIGSPTQQEDPRATAAAIDVALVARILVYSAWHALLGVLLGVGVVLAVAIGLLVLRFLAA